MNMHQHWPVFTKKSANGNRNLVVSIKLNSCLLFLFICLSNSFSDLTYQLAIDDTVINSIGSDRKS
jgi:hypothetical protein